MFVALVGTGDGKGHLWERNMEGFFNNPSHPEWGSIGNVFILPSQSETFYYICLLVAMNLALGKCLVLG